MESWPSTLVPYHRTDTFTEETVPDALLREHDTADGAWALIRVLEGELGFIDLDAGREMTLGPKSPGFVEPGQRHRVEVRGPVKFYLEFFRDASAEEEE